MDAFGPSADFPERAPDERIERVASALRANMCVTHAMGVRQALDAPGRYEVRWGMAGAEKIARRGTG
jgi:hypothetical protein